MLGSLAGDAVLWYRLGKVETRSDRQARPWPVSPGASSHLPLHTACHAGMRHVDGPSGLGTAQAEAQLECRAQSCGVPVYSRVGWSSQSH